MSASSTFPTDFSSNIDDDYARHETELQLQNTMYNPVSFHAQMMGNIMYFHQALKQPDASSLVKAIVNEVNGHVDNKH